MSAKTWWWIGAGTAAAAALTGGALIYRSRRESQTLSLDPTAIPTDLGGGRTTPSSLLRSEICRQWKVGNDRPRWRPALFDEINSNIEAAIADQDRSWRTEAQRSRQAFDVARQALRQTCPSVPLPLTEADVQELSTSFYWDELWGRFYATAHNMLADYGV